MSENQEPMQVTGKGLDKVLAGVIATLGGYVLVKWLLLPEIKFWEFFLTEVIIMTLFTVMGRIFRIKK